MSRRVVARRTLLLLPLAVAAACSDVSPTAPASPSPAGAAFKKSSPSPSGAVITESFVYDGKALKQSFGDGHEVDFTPSAVCDPATSGYGPGLWDQPCAPLKKPITFTVTSSRDADGRPQVTFSPDVRFVPGGNVTLVLNDNPGHGKKATVLWCSPLVDGCVDESATDSELQTHTASGRVARRVKHFSGYNVVFGLDGSVGSSGGM